MLSTLKGRHLFPGPHLCPSSSHFPQAAGVCKPLSSHKLMSPKLLVHFCWIHEKYEHTNVLGTVVKCKLIFRNIEVFLKKGEWKNTFILMVTSPSLNLNDHNWKVGAYHITLIFFFFTCCYPPFLIEAVSWRKGSLLANPKDGDLALGKKQTVQPVPSCLLLNPPQSLFFCLSHIPAPHWPLFAHGCEWSSSCCLQTYPPLHRVPRHPQPFADRSFLYGQAHLELLISCLSLQSARIIAVLCRAWLLLTVLGMAHDVCLLLF